MIILRCFAILLAVTLSPVVAADEAVDPSTLKDKVTITLDKKMIVQFDQKGDVLSAPKVVEKPGDKPPTPIFEFRKLNEMIILTTKNPYPKDLKFRALARHKGRKDYIETSILPVKSGLLGIELWQEPIEELILFDFKLVDGR